MENIEELRKKIKEEPENWELEVFHFACRLACKLAEEIMKEMDDALKDKEALGMKVVGFKEKWVISLPGDIKLRRRLYRDKQGNYHFLLDERIGLDKGSRVSPMMKKLAVQSSTDYTFREVEGNMKAVFPWAVSHTTVHNLSSKVADSHIEEEEKEIKALYEDGVIPESEGKTVPYLFMEADGINISLQREKERKAEIKGGIAYEGWEEIGKGRYKLKGKSVYAGVMDGKRFWEGFSLNLAKEYDLARVGKVIVGGDGASWVKEGAELFGGLYELDRFHLKRALHQGLGSDPLANEIYQACVKGEVASVEKLLTRAQQEAGKERVEEVMRLRGYLMDNYYGLRDYRVEINGEGLRGLGAVESNVDKLFADRMKKRGMSWTKEGANRMARLISLSHSGKLDTKQKISIGKPAPTLGSTPHRSEGEDYGAGHGGTWLEASLPALYGSHADRPWVQMLRKLTRGHIEGVAHATHPESQPTKS